MSLPRRRVVGLLAGFLAGTLGGYLAGLVRPPRATPPAPGSPAERGM